jgi:glutamyl-tRNA synthetase
MHLGSARTALYNYLLAQQTGGKFVLRIEDTDRRRFVPGSEQELIDGIHWLGIQYNEGPDIGGPYGPYRQSERKEIYQKYARQLVEMGKAFYCFCTPERLAALRESQLAAKQSIHYDGTCRNIPLEEADRRIANGEPYVIRFKAPTEGVTVVKDVLRGEIVVENRTIDDYILVKSDGLALYHLAATIDDHLMEITHVIRGSEWLPTLPLHALIHRTFGWEEPTWMHLSVFLKPSGAGKMSKRDAADLMKDGHSIFVKDMRELGYTPEAVVNWVALMGWSYDDRTEFFTMPDLIEKFSIDKLNPSPAAINFTKLDYFNGLHIRAFPTDVLAQRVKPYLIQAGFNPDDATLRKIAPIVQERLTTLDDVVSFAGFFFKDDVEPDVPNLVAKGLTTAESAAVARQSLEIIEKLPDMRLSTAEPAMRAFVENNSLKPGQVFGIIRAAVTGQKVSPPLFESMEIIGKEKVIRRMRRAVNLLDQLVESQP